MKPTARSVALDALDRIERQEAYANLLLPLLLASSRLSQRDRAFATELVYGTVRMRRACDWLVDRFVERELDGTTRNLLRMGAYQLQFLGTPPYAVVSTSVELGGRARRLAEAVLRRVGDARSTPEWPDDATRLSYPDWIFDRLRADLGPDRAVQAMEAMNAPATVHERPDGYVQDLASQWTAAYVDAQAGERVADLCAGPGGKATALAASGAFVAAGDVRYRRARLVRKNTYRLHTKGVGTFVGDAARPPLRIADRVLIDAPCSGLGVLRRRPDARWRVREESIDGLVAMQRGFLLAAGDLVRPGGRLVYSVCTMTTAETLAIDEWLAAARPDLVAVPPPGDPWMPLGRGGLLLPQTADTDGMYVLGLQRTS